MIAVAELNQIQDSFGQAIKLIGGIDDLNTTERSVVTKVGKNVYNTLSVALNQV